MTDLTQIENQLSNLFSSELDPVQASLTRLEIRLSALSSPIPLSTRSQQNATGCHIIKKAPKLFQYLYVKILQTLLQGTKYYGKECNGVQEKYRAKRMESYYTTVQTIICFGILFSKTRSFDMGASLAAIDLLSKESQKAQAKLDNICMQIGFVLLNLQEFVTEQSCEVVQNLEARNYKQHFSHLKDSLQKMSEDQLLQFLYQHSKDKDVLKYIQDRKKGTTHPVQFDFECT